MSTDIREWARENGVQLGSKGPVPKKVRDQYLEATGSALGEAVEFDSEHGGTVTLDTGEHTPQVQAKQTPVERARGAFKRKSREGVPDKPSRRRASTAGAWQWSWVGLANAAARGGFVPVGRVMELQSPVAGIMIEQATKGTVADRMIQPFARQSDRAKTLSALVLPPFLVAAIQQRPQLYPQLAPMLEECLYAWVEIAGPEVAKKAKIRAEREAQYGTEVKEMMQIIFAPMVAEAEAAQAAAQEAMEQTEPEGRPRATRRKTSADG